MHASAINLAHIAATFIAGTITAMRRDTFDSSNGRTICSQPIPAIPTATAVDMTDTGRHIMAALMAVLSADFASRTVTVAASGLAIDTMGTDLVTAVGTLVTGAATAVTEAMGTVATVIDNQSSRKTEFTGAFGACFRIAIRNL